MQQKEPQVPPPVSPGPEVRRATASCRGEGCWDFGNSQPVEARLHAHLAGDLHPGGSQVELGEGRLVQAPHAAVVVPYGAVEEEAPQSRQGGRPEVAMQRGHRSGTIFAQKPVSHDEVVALAKFQKKRREIREVVTVVRVAEDDITTVCRRNAAEDRASVARMGDRNDPTAQLLADGPRAVGTAS